MDFGLILPKYCLNKSLIFFFPQIACLSLARDSIGVGLLGEYLIAVGGYDGTQFHKTVEQFDSESNEWTQLAPLNYNRAGACVVSVPNFLTATTTV